MKASNPDGRDHTRSPVDGVQKSCVLEVHVASKTELGDLSVSAVFLSPSRLMYQAVP